MAAAFRALRPVYDRLGTRGSLALIALALVYLAVAQPWTEPWPAGAGPVGSTPSAQAPVGDSGARAGAAHGDQTDVDPAELSDVLTDQGRGVFRSPAGLRYTRGSVHGHRLAHLLSHARDDPARDGPHGVFDESDPAELVRLIDALYLQAQEGRATRSRRERERTVYTVDAGERIGYVGGETGARRGRPTARHVRMVVEGDRLITAYPVIP